MGRRILAENWTNKISLHVHNYVNTTTDHTVNIKIIGKYKNTFQHRPI